MKSLAFLSIQRKVSYIIFYCFFQSLILLKIMKALEAILIKQLAAEVGFDLCGICPTRNFSAERDFFEEWVRRGMHGALHYLERNVGKRFSVSELVPGARSVVVCGVCYKNDTSLSAGWGEGLSPKVASYARAADYHVTVKGMLSAMTSLIARRYGEFRFRTFTDTAPLLEKRMAAEAGLGFIGRNTLLVSPVFGSFVLLGEIVMDVSVDKYDTPYRGVGCGNCSRCVQNCPAGALTEAGIDVGRCIAGITIEKTETECGEGKRTRSCHGWIFGCDECQSVCPYNAASPLYSNPLFQPIFDPRRITRDEWLDMSPEEFDRLFGATPLTRSGLEKIKRLLSEGIPKSPPR